MKTLRELPNIGVQLSLELVESGLASVDRLLNAGSLQAALCLQNHGFDVCANKLYALEGAIRGIRWHAIPSTERSALWEAFQLYGTPRHDS